MVRDASKALLDEDDVLGKTVSDVVNAGSNSLVTYACNMVHGILDPVVSSASVDIGTHAIHDGFDACSLENEFQIGKQENKIEINDDYDEIFDVNYDNLNDDKYDDDYVMLL